MIIFKDFLEMFIHHLATISLMVLSWTCHLHRYLCTSHEIANDGKYSELDPWFSSFMTLQTIGWSSLSLVGTPSIRNFVTPALSCSPWPGSTPDWRTTQLSSSSPPVLRLDRSYRCSLLTMFLIFSSLSSWSFTSSGATSYSRLLTRYWVLLHYQFTVSSL